MSEDEKPKVTPGWNDPPLLHYSPENPPPKSRIGNKRVAFPISNAPLPMPNLIPSPNTSNNPLEWNSLEALNLTMGYYSTIVKDLKGAEIDIIQEQIDLMKATWETGKLEVEIQKIILNIFKNLLEKQSVAAEAYCMQLVSKHAAESSQWVAGLASLVRICQ